MTPHSSESPAVAPEGVSELQAARARLKTGRNERCPCGSGKKYKKCCLTGDEVRARQAAVAQAAAAAAAAEEAMLPSPSDAEPNPEETETDLTSSLAEDAGDETAPLSELDAKIEAVWNDFEALAHPTTEQMDGFLDQLMALPPHTTNWNDTLQCFAANKHSDLAGVFRRISASVAHTKETSLEFFYWGAAEVFVKQGMIQLLPEVAAGFQRVDRENWDPDALTHIEEFLVAEGFDDETLRLAEHFLPLERGDDLGTYLAPDQCSLIFELRVGQALRDSSAWEHSPEKIPDWLVRGIETEVDTDRARKAALVVRQASLPPWTRAEFDFFKGDLDLDQQAWRDYLRVHGTLIRVAQQAWQIEKVSPGCALYSLSLVLGSVYDLRDLRGKASKKTRANLLDHLRPAGFEERLVRSCGEFFGLNEPRARLLLQGHELLTRFAVRHALISPDEAAQTEKELLRLRNIGYGSE